jgi:hypothetical protein
MKLIKYKCINKRKLHFKMSKFRKYSQKLLVENYFNN